MSAEGRWANGILPAKHVKFHASVRLEGDIASISGSALTLVGLSGVTVQVNSQTEFNNASLADLSISEHVRVRGRVSSKNSVTATRVDVRPADNGIDVQGPGQPIAGNVIVILGISIDACSIDQFESVSGVSMNRASFLGEVKVGSLVKVKGKLNGATVNWDEAELED